MKFLIALLLIPLLTIPAFAESQTLPTDKGTLDVKLTYDSIEPNVQTKLEIDFLNPQTQKVQEHIDYTIAISKDGETVFGPIPLTHTSLGSVKIPIEFNLGEGIYSIDFEVEGILFQPIPTETVSFDILVGEAHGQPTEQEQPTEQDENGGCLIATATFGSELAPQVQQLRELRDNTVLQTNSGTAFMTTFTTRSLHPGRKPMTATRASRRWRQNWPRWTACCRTSRTCTRWGRNCPRNACPCSPTISPR